MNKKPNTNKTATKIKTFIKLANIKKGESTLNAYLAMKQSKMLNSKSTALLLLCWISSLCMFAQAKTEQDKQAIKAQCGCYSITFDYAETFPQDTAYKIHQPYHAAASAEWIFVEEESEDKIVIQHLLVVNDTIIIKHWRQDWLYQNTELYQFDKNQSWKFVQLPKEKVKGQWTQKVYQVDDSPRYEGTATWVHVDEKHYWESTTDAPLPRREFSKRSDYNVMQRTNRHVITDYGWLHEQDNLKIIRNGTTDSILVAEKGLNKYTRINDSKCQPAKDWWEKNSAYWKLVRTEWDNVFTRNKDLHLTKKVNEKRLYETLFDLGDELASQAESNPASVTAKISQTIQAYITENAATENTTY